MAAKKRVMVLFGGRSGEHEVSLDSAASVIDALDPAKYEVVPVAVTRDGKWLSGLTPAQLRSGVPPGAADDDPAAVALAAVGRAGGTRPVDVVIPVLHGTFGEDGTVQGLLELAGLPYVGAGVLGSALAMDKILMKTALWRHGIPQASFYACRRRDWEAGRLRVTGAVEKELGFPCFVKPANLGSSVGISKVHSREELAPAMDLAARYDRRIIVEEFIDGREVEVGVLGNDDPAASLPGEIVPLREFYDYQAKYSDGLARLEIPARLPPATVTRLRETAVQVFKILDGAGLARVDFFLRGGEVLVNEINTMPGFTRLSMFPKLWEATGIPYRELLDRMIDLALERHRDKSRCQTSLPRE